MFLLRFDLWLGLMLLVWVFGVVRGASWAACFVGFRFSFGICVCLLFGIDWVDGLRVAFWFVVAGFWFYVLGLFVLNFVGIVWFDLLGSVV